MKIFYPVLLLFYLIKTVFPGTWEMKDSQCNIDTESLMTCSCVISMNHEKEEMSCDCGCKKHSKNKVFSFVLLPYQEKDHIKKDKNNPKTNSGLGNTYSYFYKAKQYKTYFKKTTNINPHYINKYHVLYCCYLI